MKKSRNKEIKKKLKKRHHEKVLIPIPVKPVRIKQNYFDNKLVEAMVIRYQKGDYEDTKLFNDILEHLGKIVVAIINKYHFYYYYNYDDLVQEGRIACMDALRRFDLKRVRQPGKSVFSYFSNVVKRNLRFFTLNKNRKIIKETKIDPMKLSTYAIFNQKKEEAFFDGKEKVMEFFNYIKTVLFKDKKRMFNLACIMEKYIKEVSGSNFKAKDFVAYCKSFGFTSDYSKRFLAIIRENKGEIQ